MAHGLTPCAMLTEGLQLHQTPLKKKTAVFTAEVRDTGVPFKRDSILGGGAIRFALASCPQNRDFFSLGETEVQKRVCREPGFSIAER